MIHLQHKSFVYLLQRYEEWTQNTLHTIHFVSNG